MQRVAILNKVVKEISLVRCHYTEIQRKQLSKPVKRKNIPVRGNSKAPLGAILASLRNSKKAIWPELSNQGEE